MLACGILGCIPPNRHQSTTTAVYVIQPNLSTGWNQHCYTAYVSSLMLTVCVSIIGPILWGHSGPLCHTLSSSWTSMRRWRATVLVCDSSDTWWMGVRRLAVANGPNIFQMLLVLLGNFNASKLCNGMRLTMRCHISLWGSNTDRCCM